MQGPKRMAKIYLDNSATTRTDPRVVEAMLPYFTERYGNAASLTHTFGQEAEEAVEQARERVACLIGAHPREIVFTSGATESNNLALKGVAAMYRPQGDHFIAAATEHKAVLDPLRRLAREGFQITILPVDAYGQVSVEQVAQALTPRTVLVSVMAANNEIGTLQPIRALGRLCKERGVLFHTDAAQAAGKIPLNVEDMGIDLLSLSGHKIYGPKGVGALYVRRRDPRVQLAAQMDGGGHVRGMRSGTLNVPGIVGLGEACDICRRDMAEESQRLARLRDRLRNWVETEVDEVYVNGSWQHRLPNNLNMSFAYVDSESLLMGMNDVALSTGSACTSATLEPSHVLKALGIGDDLAHGAVRFGLGRFNTEEEIDYVARRVVEVVRKLREISPLYELAKHRPA